MNAQILNDWIPEILQTVINASNAIMSVYSQDFDNQIKTDGSPVTQADYQSNEVLQQGLAFTKLPMITEESIHAPFEVRQHWKTLWCIDPLDGTKEFIKKNDEFVICLSLIHEQQPVFGLIASPVQKTILLGGPWYAPKILTFNQFNEIDSSLPLEKHTQINQPLAIAGSRSHLSGSDLKFTNAVKAKHGEIAFVKKGSALKFFDLAQGMADVYPRFAPTMEWDIAAGQAILEALGGDVIHAETGAKLTYNKANLVNPYFIARTAAYLAINP